MASTACPRCGLDVPTANIALHLLRCPADDRKQAGKIKPAADHDGSKCKIDFEDSDDEATHQRAIELSLVDRSPPLLPPTPTTPPASYFFADDPTGARDRDLARGAASYAASVNEMSVRDLKQLIVTRGGDPTGFLMRDELVTEAMRLQHAPLLRSTTPATASISAAAPAPAAPPAPAPSASTSTRQKKRERAPPIRARRTPPIGPLAEGLQPPPLPTPTAPLSSEWTCAQCTLINESSSVACLACEVRNPALPPLSLTPPSTSSPSLTAQASLLGGLVGGTAAFVRSNGRNTIRDTLRGAAGGAAFGAAAGAIGEGMAGAAPARESRGTGANPRGAMELLASMMSGGGPGPRMIPIPGGFVSFAVGGGELGGGDDFDELSYEQLLQVSPGRMII